MLANDIRRPIGLDVVLYTTESNCHCRVGSSDSFVHMIAIGVCFTTTSVSVLTSNDPPYNSRTGQRRSRIRHWKQCQQHCAPQQSGFFCNTRPQGAQHASDKPSLWTVPI